MSDVFNADIGCHGTFIGSLSVCDKVTQATHSVNVIVILFQFSISNNHIYVIALSGLNYTLVSECLLDS